MKYITINSDYYGDYKAEFIFSVDYSKGVLSVSKFIDLWKKYFGKSGFSKWVNPWDDKYPDIIKTVFPCTTEEIYYPTEKSAPGHPLCDDKSIEKFKHEYEVMKSKSI